MDYSRILKILNPQSLGDRIVMAAGCGSGNALALAELAKNGVTRFELWDHDVLEPVNLVRHVLGRAHLGRNKAEAMADWIYDRNEEARVAAYPDRIEDSPPFAAGLADKDATRLVLCGVDDMNTRYRINRLCVESGTPFVAAMVFRRGMGGMVFRYEPGRGGCFNCLTEFARQHGMTIEEAESEPTGASDEQVYGLGLDAFEKNPGLSIDIGFISLIMARVALEALLPEYGRRDFPPLRSNLIAFANRPDPAQGMKKFFQAEHFFLHPQEDCVVCGV